MNSSAAVVESPFKRIASDFAASRLALAGLAVFVLILIVALGAPLISAQNPYDLAQLDILDSKLAPGGRSISGLTFWLGSDDQGRDMLSAIFYGLRISLGVGAVSTLAALAIGLTVGLAAAWFGGRIDTVIMRLVDIQLSFPAILIALILLAALGQGVDKIVIATVQIAHAIALEATLSFLGLGMPITSPSLGLLIANGFTHLLSGKYWISFFPGIALLVTIVSINLVGDQLRDVLNPRLQR